MYVQLELGTHAQCVLRPSLSRCFDDDDLLHHQAVEVLSALPAASARRRTKYRVPTSLGLFGDKQMARQEIHTDWRKKEDEYNKYYAKYNPGYSGMWGFKMPEHPWNQDKRLKVMLNRVMYGPGAPYGYKALDDDKYDTHGWNLSQEWGNVRRFCKYKKEGKVMEFGRKLFGMTQECKRYMEEPANYYYEWSRRLFEGGLKNMKSKFAANRTKKAIENHARNSRSSILDLDSGLPPELLGGVAGVVLGIVQTSSSCQHAQAFVAARSASRLQLRRDFL